jgi:hypothetical protein
MLGARKKPEESQRFPLEKKIKLFLFLFDVTEMGAASAGPFPACSAHQ